MNAWMRLEDLNRLAGEGALAGLKSAEAQRVPEGRAEAQRHLQPQEDEHRQRPQHLVGNGEGGVERGRVFNLLRLEREYTGKNKRKDLGEDHDGAESEKEKQDNIEPVPRHAQVFRDALIGGR